MKRSAATGTLVNTAGRITGPPLGRSARLRELNVRMRRVRARKPGLPRSCSSLTLPLSLHFILSLDFSPRPTHMARLSLVPLSRQGVALPLTVLPLSPCSEPPFFPPLVKQLRLSRLFGPRSLFPFEPSALPPTSTKFPHLAPTRSFPHPEIYSQLRILPHVLLAQLSSSLACLAKR